MMVEQYTEQMFTEFVTDKVITPDRVCHLIELKYGRKPSWNTALKYLDKAVKAGGICKGQVGIYNIYYRK